MSLTRIHGDLLSFPVIGIWLIICFWSLALRFLRYEETPTFWRAVSAAQILLAVQLLVGLTLLAMGARPGRPGGEGGFTLLRHLNYGVLSPLVVLFFAHKFAREERWNPYSIFALAGLVNFGLLGMAWNVGIGRL